MERSTPSQKSLHDYFAVIKSEYSRDKIQCQGKLLRPTTKENLKLASKSRYISKRSRKKAVSQEDTNLPVNRTKLHAEKHDLKLKQTTNNSLSHLLINIIKQEEVDNACIDNKSIHDTLIPNLINSSKVMDITLDELQELIKNEKNLVIENNVLTVIVDDDSEDEVENMVKVSPTKKIKIEDATPITKQTIKNEQVDEYIGTSSSGCINQSTTNLHTAKRVLFPAENAIKDEFSTNEFFNSEKINYMDTILPHYKKLTNIGALPLKAPSKANTSIKNLIEIKKNEIKVLEELVSDFTDDNESVKIGGNESPTKTFKSVHNQVKSEHNVSNIVDKDNLININKHVKKEMVPAHSIKKEFDDLMYGYDDDTVDLNLYGLDNKELEVYSPSILNCQNDSSLMLNSSKEQSITSLPSTSKTCITEVVLQNGNNCIKEEVNEDLDATIIYDSSNEENKALGQLSFVMNMFRMIWKEIQESTYLQSLLSPDDKEDLVRLFVLPNEYQEVILRLFIRLPKWYQVTKFMDEIKLSIPTNGLPEMLDTLESFQFISQDYSNMETLQTLLNLMLNQEIKQILKSLKMKVVSYKKNDMINAILNYASSQKTLGVKDMTSIITEQVVEKLGRCIKLNDRFSMSLFRLQLLYHFALPEITSHSELYLFINGLNNGDIILPTFIVTKDIHIFKDYSAFKSYADAVKLYFTYISTKEKKQKTKTSKFQELAKKAFDELNKIQSVDYNNSHGSRFTAGHLYTKVLDHAITDLTKNNTLVQKYLIYLLQSKFCTSKRGGWYISLSMHKEKYDKNIPEAVEAIRNGLADEDVCLIDKYSLSARAIALTKRKAIQDPMDMLLVTVPNVSEIEATTINAKPWKTSRKVGGRLLYTEDSALFTVEEIARANYTRKGYPNGVHCEGALLMTLFAAFFWDIIYSDQPGAFITKLQSIPLDLYSKEFYVRRKSEIDKRLENVATGWGDDEVFQKLEQWKVQHAHEKSIHSAILINNSGVLEDSVVCLTRRKVAKMLERLIKDIRQFQAGMPDLFLWNVERKMCLFAEVKSQRDVLSMKQKAWLTFLKEIEVNVEVCYVNSIGEKASKVRTMQL